MQVDLFSKSVLVGRANRQVNQIATRQFKIGQGNTDFAGLSLYYTKEDELNEKKRELQALLGMNREYSYIGTAGCDNLFLLEALNLAHNCKQYSMVIDFSESLDFVLNYTYGCKIDDIRKIENYDEISRAILNYNFTNLGGAKFSDVLNASDELKKAFVELSDKAKQQNIYFNDRLPWMIYKFYEKILSNLSSIKFYVMVDLCEQLNNADLGKGVIRSMNYSSVVATIDSNFKEKILLHHPAGDCVDYEISVRTYRPYEYIGEVLRQDASSREICC